jgi:hypothetical protein
MTELLEHDLGDCEFFLVCSRFFYQFFPSQWAVRESELLPVLGFQYREG